MESNIDFPNDSKNFYFGTKHHSDGDNFSRIMLQVTLQKEEKRSVLMCA
jgi:uncharacterized protein YebE (UPF0316 family)